MRNLAGSTALFGLALLFVLGPVLMVLCLHVDYLQDWEIYETAEDLVVDSYHIPAGMMVLVKDDRPDNVVAEFTFQIDPVPNGNTVYVKVVMAKSKLRRPTLRKQREFTPVRPQLIGTPTEPQENAAVE